MCNSFEKVRGEDPAGTGHATAFYRSILPRMTIYETLDVMRQPIEDKIVTISRAQGSLTFPANFQLVAAMNPCPCGYYGDPVKACTCSDRVRCLAQ